MAALAQRRSEQINAANSAAAAAAKAPVLSPGLSSTHSERSCVSVEDGPRLELTDAFEELQAFFGGGPPDSGVPSAQTKVRGTPLDLGRIECGTCNPGGQN